MTKEMRPAATPRQGKPQQDFPIPTAYPDGIDDDVFLAATGDRSAFDRLVLSHQSDVVNTAFYFLGNYDDAVDATQEAFLKAYRNMGSFRGDASFKTWILMITINTVRSMKTRARAKKRSGTVTRLDQGGSAKDGCARGDNGIDPPDPKTHQTPSSLLERKEVKEALEQAILDLDERSREVVVLRDLAGESYDSIATGLGVPTSTVKSRVHRAHLELRRVMAQYL